jgi:hypothetical protein
MATDEEVNELWLTGIINSKSGNKRAWGASTIKPEVTFDPTINKGKPSLDGYNYLDYYKEFTFSLPFMTPGLP